MSDTAFKPEALKLLIDTAQAAQKPTLLDAPERPDGAVQKLLVKGDQHELLAFERVPDDRNHAFNTLDSFLELYRQERSDQGGTIWHNDAQCQFYLDPGRFETATMLLTLSPLWRTLATLVPGQRLNHKAFMRLLRFTLKGAIDPAFEAAFKEFDIAKMARVKSEIGTMNASLDKNIAAAVNGPEKPNLMTVRGKIFANQDLPWTGVVELSIEIDTDDQVLVVQTLPDAYEASLRQAQVVLGAEIRARLGVYAIPQLPPATKQEAEEAAASGEMPRGEIVKVPQHLVLWGTP